MTQLQIINLALRHLGQNKIDNLNGLDPSTVVMLDFWDICLTSMFEEHQWSFANAQFELTESAVTPPVGWLVAYDMPTENVAAVWLVYNEATVSNKDEQDFDSYYDIDSGTVVLVSDLEEAVCEYTYIIEDTAAWPKKFCHAMSYFLASSACVLLTGDADKALKLMTIYNGMLDEVQRMDSFKASKKVKLSSSYQTSRG